MSTETETLSLRLRRCTAELHTLAERSELQRLLVTGRVSRGQYTQHLSQMLLVHRALDGALRRASRTCGAVAAVVREEQYQEPYLLEDLAFMGFDPASARPRPGTARIVEEIAATEGSEPAALLGYHYVLEGANNGNRFISKPIAGMLGVRSGEPGTRYLDPYGDRQRELWAQFKVDLNGAGLSAEQQARAVECAQRMFEAVASIGDQVLEAEQAPVTVCGPAVGAKSS